MNFGTNLNDLRTRNRALVLELIVREGTLSRMDLTHRSGLTQPAITQIVTELVRLDLVREVGLAESGVGRKPIMLAVNPDVYHIIALDIERDTCTIGLVDLQAQVISTHTIPQSLMHNPEDALLAIEEVIREIVARESTAGIRVLGIGIGAPGPLDTNQGVILAPPNFPDWDHIAITARLSSSMGYPTFLDNNAKACALAELWFGLGKQYHDFIYVSAESGIGGAFVMDGCLVRGQQGLAGELSHVSIDPHGMPCACGNVGCLEAFASPPAIVHRYQVECGDSSQTNTLAVPSDVRLAFEHILHSSRQGDAVGRRVLADAMFYLGIGLTNLLNLMNPEAVILGRSFALLGIEWTTYLSEYVNTHAIPRAFGRTAVLSSSLRDEAPLVGAAALVLEQVFKGAIPVFESK